MPKNNLKGIIHCHSSYSMDSVVSINEIVAFIKKNQLDFVILSDHDTIKGSLALQKKVLAHKDLNVQVPVTAEYGTEYGDVIAAFITSEIDPKLPFKDFVEEVRSQGGLLLFPHPFKSHKNIDAIAEQSDLIEVFNSRHPSKYDKLSLDLATKYKKNTYWASDAHLLQDYKLVMLDLESDATTLKDALLNGRIRPLQTKKSLQTSLLLSQLIKGIKLMKGQLIYKTSIRLLKNALKGRLFQRIT